MKKIVFYHVRPRYTPGSPGMVSREQALAVVAEERRAYQHALEGAYGPQEQARAEQLGLVMAPLPDAHCGRCMYRYDAHKDGARGHEWDGNSYSVVEAVEEHAHNHWLVTDLVTGEVYQRRFHVAVTDRQRGAIAHCLKCRRARDLRAE